MEKLDDKSKKEIRDKYNSEELSRISNKKLDEAKAIFKKCLGKGQTPAVRKVSFVKNKKSLLRIVSQLHGIAHMAQIALTSSLALVFASHNPRDML